VPGLNIAKTALLTEWKGKLSAKLAPSDETWMLVLFDVPKGTQDAVLRVGNTKLEIKPEARPFGNLIPKRCLNAGEASVQIVSVNEDVRTPVIKTPPKQADNRFVLIEINVLGCAPKAEIRSLDFDLTTAAGVHAGQPGFFKQNIVGVDGSYAMMRAGSALTLFFEVPKNVPLADLKLNYLPKK
jgi:hypothetical protein